MNEPHKAGDKGEAGAADYVGLAQDQLKYAAARAVQAAQAVPALDRAITLARTGDENGIYRVMLALGALGLAVLVGGWLIYTAVGPRVTDSIPASIRSIEGYNSARGSTDGHDSQVFSIGSDPAGVVDFNALPADYTIRVEWFDDSGDSLIRYKPLNAGTEAQQDQGGRAAFPMFTEADTGVGISGSFLFVVQRVEGDRVTEVLARRTIRVRAG